MRKVLLVVALLLLATPAFAADVTITADKVGAPVGNVQKVRIGYTGAATADAIRAFALSLQTDLTSDANLQNIADFNRGESNKPGGGYGIFPAKFRQYIQVQNPTTADWGDTNYTPLAEWGDPNAGWGNQTKWMVVELGTLYTEANTPGTSGTLFTVDVCSPSATDCNLCIALDMIRGGVVKKDANAATVTLPPGGSGAPAGCLRITYAPPCVTIPTIVGSTTAAADAAIIAAGLTVGTKTTQYSDTIAANIVMTQDTGCVPAGTPVNYKYSLGRFPTPAQIIYPKWDADSNVPVYWSQVAGATSYQLDRSSNSGGAWANVYTGTATFKAERLETTGAFYRYRVMAKNADSNSLYMTGTADCNAYLSRCYANGNTSDPNWSLWLSAGRPDCWCKASGAQEPNGSGYQCDGDADGATGGASYRVYTIDQGLIVANWKKTAAQVTSDPNVTLAGKLKIHAACADIDHKAGGASYRVYTIDQGIIVANWKKLGSSAVTATNRLPGNCPR